MNPQQRLDQIAPFANQRRDRTDCWKTTSRAPFSAEILVMDLKITGMKNPGCWLHALLRVRQFGIKTDMSILGCSAIGI